MAVSIIQKLRGRRDERVAKSESDYAQCIRKVAAGARVELDVLADAADNLNLSADNVDTDVNVLREHDLLTRDVKALEQREGELLAALNIADQLADLDRQRLALLRAQADAKGAIGRLVGNRQRLAQIKAANPRLFPSATI